MSSWSLAVPIIPLWYSSFYQMKIIQPLWVSYLVLVAWNPRTTFSIQLQQIYQHRFFLYLYLHLLYMCYGLCFLNMYVCISSKWRICMIYTHSIYYFSVGFYVRLSIYYGFIVRMSSTLNILKSFWEADRPWLMNIHFLTGHLFPSDCLF